MRKNICHLMLFLILLAVVFNHFKFASLDKRNAYDFHAQCYGSLAVEYNQMLQNQNYIEGYTEIPVYAKIVGHVFYFFGKDYFTFRMVSLFFFIFYLTVLYLSVSLLTKSYLIGLLSLLLHLLVPGIMFYSRLCWPHMWAACFTLLAVVFLLVFFEKTKWRMLYFFLFVVFLGVSVSMYYSSIIYVFLICFSMLLCNHKKIFTKSFLMFFLAVVLPLLLAASYIFYDELFSLFVEYKTGNYFSIQALVEYRLLFVSSLHYIFYFILVVSSLFYLFFFKKNRGEFRNLILFVLFFFFSVAASFLSYPTDVTVLGLSSACVLIAWFILKTIKLKSGAVVTGIFFVLALSCNFYPGLFFLGAGDTLYAHKITLEPDTNQWGTKELKSWLLSVEKSNPKIALLNDTFYPLYGTNYVQPFDLQLLANEDIYVIWLNEGSFYENKRHAIYNKKMSFSAAEDEYMFLSFLEADTEINKKKTEENFLDMDMDFDYLIFDDISKPYSWFLVLKDMIECYRVILDKQEGESKEMLYRKMRKEMKEKFADNVKVFAFDIKARFRSLYRYKSLRLFFKSTSLLAEEKRIKCFGKDIVIYRRIKN